MQPYFIDLAQHGGELSAETVATLKAAAITRVSVAGASQADLAQLREIRPDVDFAAVPEGTVAALGAVTLLPSRRSRFTP